MNSIRNASSTVVKQRLTSFFLALVILSLMSPAARVQPSGIPPSEMPQGESVLKNFDVTVDASFRGGQHGEIVYHRYRTTSCFATTGGIYSEEGAVFSYTHKIWTPPAEIKGIWLKNNSDTNNEVSLLVYTADGNMHQVTLRRSTRLLGTVFLSSDKIIPSIPTSNGVSIAAGDDLYAVSGGVVYALHDSVHWVVDTVGLNGAYLSAMALDSSQNVYVSSYSGMFEQGLKESTWHPMNGAPNAQFLWVSREDVIYAGTGAYLYSSTNRGVTWRLDSAGIGNAGAVGAMDQDTTGNLYAITSSYYPGVGDHVWMKPVGGGTWQSIDHGLNAISASATPGFMTGVTADSLGVHVATKFGEFFLRYGSSSWQEISRGVDAANIYSYYRFPNGRQLATTSLGLYTKDVKDTAWTKRFPIGSYLSSVKFFVDNAGRIYAIGANQTINYNTRANDIFISTDHGTTWTPDTTGLSFFNGGMEFVDEMGTEHLAGLLQNTQNIQIFSKQAGGQWAGDSTGYSSRAGDAAFAFATDHHGSIYLVVTNLQKGDRMLRRSINGGSWSEISTSALGGVPYAMTATKDGKLIGGNTNTAVGYFDGTSWNAMPNPSGLTKPSGYPQSVDSSNRLWVLYGSIDQNYYYTPYGTYWTSDLGQHWTKAADGSFNFASLVSFGDTTYGLNSGNGLFYFVPGAASVAKESISTNSISIFPNPTNGVAKIQVDGAIASKIEIFDVLGNKCADLHGNKEILWSGTNASGILLPNGIYFVRVSGTNEQGKPLLSSKQIVIQR